MVFKQHISFQGGVVVFRAAKGDLKSQTGESEIIVDAGTVEEVLLIARSEAYIIQLDKIAPAKF
jgi:nicotinate-nucleotide pyrophosphorylase